MPEGTRLLDLCAGKGGWSRPFREAGWEVVTVDNDPRHEPTLCADLLALRPEDVPGPWTLITFSPPCDEFARESMPWTRTGRTPSTRLLEAGLALIRALRPAWWVVENVRGSVRHFRPFLGPPVKRYGPFYLWGDFPPIDPAVRYRRKESYSSAQRAERAMIPPLLSRAVFQAVAA